MKFLHRITLLSIFLSLCYVSGYGKIVIVSPGELKMRLQLAQSGDVLYLRNGEYPINNSTGFIISKNNISIIGESRDGVIITGDNVVTAGASPDKMCTLLVDAGSDNFYVENVTIRNTAGYGAGQAIALYSRADKVVINNCNIEGYQDTHYSDKGGRNYIANSITKGTVDFIYGDAAIMYDNSTIICRAGGGYVTAPDDAKIITNQKLHGIVIKNSSILPDAGTADNSFTLGRPWGDGSSSVYINCKMGNQIAPRGWNEWDGREASAFFAEYNSMNLDGTPADISQRVSWSLQLTATDTSFYSIQSFFNKAGDEWNPLSVLTVPDKPKDVYLYQDSTIKWESVQNVSGYAILYKDSVVNFITTNTYKVEKIDEGYSICSVSKNGVFSDNVDAVEYVIPPTNVKKYGEDDLIFVMNNILYVPQNEKTEVYDLMGNLVKVTIRTQELSLSNLKSGVYIVRVVPNNKGGIVTRRVLK